MFGKPGRPTEDGFLRRREIYLAVAPLIEKVGAKRLTMRQVASAAHMSIGGIYHYFPSKRDLVLFGVSAEAFTRSCEEFHSRHGDLAETDPEGFLATYLDSLETVMALCRPALVAAMELGPTTALDAIAAGVDVTLDEFVLPLRAMRPGLADADLDALQRALRRILLGGVLDRNATPSKLKEELRSILEVQVHPDSSLALRDAAVMS
jgi:AcrR family transcriptional regulator